MERRDFLSKVFTLAGLTLPPQILTAREKVKAESKNVLTKNSKLTSILEKSKSMIGNIEYNHFVEFFKLENDEDIFKKIIIVQSIFGLKTDGIIGPVTLRNIYKKIYSKDLENVSSDIKDRWEAYTYIKNIKPRIKGNKKYYGRFYPNNVFEKVHWTGLIGEYSEKGSYIDDNLKDKVKYNISEINCNVESPENKVVGIVKKIDGKYVTLIYEKGNLVLASYSSPGIKNGKPGYNKTRKGVYDSDFNQKNFVSSKGAKHIKGYNFLGSPMYFMVGIYGHGGVGSHYSPSVTGNRASHQCLRQNMKTAKRIFYINENIGKIHWDIQDN